MTWWLLLDGAAGVFLGCVTVLVIAVIRWAGRRAVRTWNTGEPERETAGRP